tara:strand:- start:59 stop:349 length:291 start_codon:yes stop_codon:yes gene_type:complete
MHPKVTLKPSLFHITIDGSLYFSVVSKYRTMKQKTYLYNDECFTTIINNNPIKINNSNNYKFYIYYDFKILATNKRDVLTILRYQTQTCEGSGDLM